MGPWTALLVAYLVGGVTFVPLLLGLVLLHAHYTLPFRGDFEGVPDGHPDSVVQDGDDTSALKTARAKERGGDGGGDGGGGGRKKDSDVTVHELDVAAGYFAVCREYTPMGINAKPMERAATTAGQATVAPPSPSVYQTMYRSIFDRKPVPGPIENNSMSHRPKKAGNIFYVVLRHGHLMLFDDEEQLEVRHVISLAHYDISIYSGGGKTPEGELFIKRNALCLTRRLADGEAAADDGLVSKPFFLFSENCSAKEDFYFALLKNQEQTFGGLDNSPPKPKQFDIKDIITLVQRLHSSEENIHSRWINAMLGRIFLSVYRTKDLENYIREKISKKISRVKKPSYLTNIVIRNIDTGEAAPFFHNLKLKEFTVEGECVVETDMRYSGNFRIEVAATAKIDLGARIKAREVNLVLALVLRRIEGHMLFKIKAPPSNRMWLSFQAMPKMEMAIEPIVSSRQITYTVILRQIENRIKEVFAETLVQPFWDDVPFFKTEHKDWRGGIFEGDDNVERSQNPAAAPGPIADDGAVEAPTTDEQATAEPPLSPKPIEKTQTMPPLETQAPATGLFGRRLGGNKTAASSAASLDSKGSAATTSRSPQIVRNSVEPVVGTAAAHVDLFKPSTSPPDHATSLIAALHSKAQQEASPVVTPVGSPNKQAKVKSSEESSISSKEEPLDAAENSDGTAPSTRRNTVSSHGSYEGSVPHSPNGSQFSQTGSIGRKFFMKRENSNTSLSTASTTGDNGPKRNNTLAAMTNAANQARQWGWNAIQRQKDGRRNSEASSHVDLSQPMGRGQPLPPPGMPLPGPTNGRTKIAPIAVPKRKPVPASVPEHSSMEAESSGEKERPKTGDKEAEKHKEKEKEKEEYRPPLPRRRRGASQAVEEDDAAVENMLVISAPAEDSQPQTPLSDGDDGEKELKLASQVSNSSRRDGIPRKPVPVPITVVKDVDVGDEDRTPMMNNTARFSADAEVEGVSTDAGLEDSEPTLQKHPEPTLEKNPVMEEKDATAVEPQLEPEDLASQDGKPLVAMPLSTTPPGPTVDDDDDFSGWMEESEQSEVEEPARDVLKPATTTV